jgi:SpoIID/LytB domain protein
MRKVFFFILLAVILLGVVIASRADEISDLQKQIDDIQKTYNDIDSANKTNKSTLDKLNAQLDQIKSQVVSIQKQITEKEAEVEQGEKVLDYQKQLLNERAKNYYKKSGEDPMSLINLLISENFSQSLENFFYQKTLLDQDRQTIIKIVSYIKDLQQKKKDLEDQQTRLATLKADVDKQSTFLAGEVAKANQYLGELQSKIAELSAQQQALIAARQSDLHIPQSAGMGGGCSSDLTNGKDPGFSPRIGFFTYGVPNRVGLNQYGAKGRAEAGQNAEQILSAYYTNYNLDKGYNQSINIHVVGTNDYGQSIDQTWNIDEYLKHLYEMPASWPAEALKAQAIAARSYVLASTNNGANTICPSQHCQVVKLEINDGNWQAAVDATKGWVMTNGGSPISAYFSSTHGGYVYDSSASISNRPWLKNGQDASSTINNFSDLNANAYDKNSPVFYCDWGARSQYGNTAWLKPEEVADIANVIMLAKRDSGTINHLYQTDIGNPAGTDTWDASRVRQELSDRGGSPFTTVNDISVSVDFGSGRTTAVIINGQSFDGKEFKDFFNLRAPGPPPNGIQIVGLLYNVEKR